MKINQVINELIQHGDTEHEGKQIVLIGKDMYVFDYGDDDMLEKINDEHDLELGGLDSSDFENEGVEDVVAGSIEDGYLILTHGSGLATTSILNTQIKKIVKHFDLRGVRASGTDFDDEYNEEEVEDLYLRKEVLKSVTETVFYHGTSFDKLKNIAKKGIYKTGNSTNFEKIVHTDLVFITTQKAKALFHARTAAKIDGTVPVIIELKVPDKDKLVLDYDVAMQYYGADHALVKMIGYDIINDHETDGKSFNKGNKKDHLDKWKQLADKNSMNTKAGHFGYRGRIAPTNFTGFIADAEYIAAYMFSEDTGMDMEYIRGGKTLDLNFFRTYKELIESAEQYMSYMEDEYDTGEDEEDYEDEDDYDEDED